MKLALGIGLAVLAVAIGVLRSATLNGYKTDRGSKVYYALVAFVMAGILAFGIIRR